LVNTEGVSDVLEEEDAGNDIAEVHAALHQKAVLTSEEDGLLVDVCLNLVEKALGRDFSIGQELSNMLLHLGDVLGSTELDGEVVVDLLDFLNLLARLLGAFEKLGEGQFVGKHVPVQVDIVYHVEVKKLVYSFIALVLRAEDLNQGHVLGSQLTHLKVG